MSDGDWYLLDRGGRRYGPYDRELIDQLAAQRELQPGTPIWHPGLARWQPAGRVLSLPTVERSDAPAPASPRAVPHPAPPPRPTATPRPPQQRALSPRTVTRPAVKPQAAAAVLKLPASPMTPPQGARRFIAALFDLMAVFVVFRLLGPALPGMNVGSFGRSAPLLFIAWALLDAAWMVRAGTTPGKALMAIRILSAQDEKLAWPRALLHASALPLLLVLLTLRTGFTIFVAVAVLILTARRLRSGFAPWWDDFAGARVIYGELPAARQALAVIAFLAGFIVILAAT